MHSGNLLVGIRGQLISWGNLELSHLELRQNTLTSLLLLTGHQCWEASTGETCSYCLVLVSVCVSISWRLFNESLVHPDRRTLFCILEGLFWFCQYCVDGKMMSLMFLMREHRYWNDIKSPNDDCLHWKDDLSSVSSPLLSCLFW